MTITTAFLDNLGRDFWCIISKHNDQFIITLHFHSVPSEQLGRMPVGRLWTAFLWLSLLQGKFLEKMYAGQRFPQELQKDHSCTFFYYKRVPDSAQPLGWLAANSPEGQG